ncbi:MAG: CoA ester lyase [bacterium]
MPRIDASTPLRSMLFSPGSSEKMVAKASVSGADAALFDLEDSVAPDMKEKAREIVAEAIGATRAAAGAPPVILVRVNGTETDLLEGDLEAITSEGLDGIFLPKPESAAGVRAADAIFSRLERERGLEEGGIGIIAQMESAAGVHRCFEICSASPRVVGVNFGSAEDADFCRDLGAQWTPEGTALLYARSKVLLEARAAGLHHPTDGVYMRLKDDDGCRADALAAKQLGYVGKAAIHPRQVPIFNEVYSPSAEEVDYYTGMLEAFREGEKAGLGAITYQGKMIDVAMAKHAENVIARARTISAL